MFLYIGACLLFTIVFSYIANRNMIFTLLQVYLLLTIKSIGLDVMHLLG